MFKLEWIQLAEMFKKDLTRRDFQHPSFYIDKPAIDTCQSKHSTSQRNKPFVKSKRFTTNPIHSRILVPFNLIYFQMDASIDTWGCFSKSQTVIAWKMTSSLFPFVKTPASKNYQFCTWNPQVGSNFRLLIGGFPPPGRASAPNHPRHSSWYFWLPAVRVASSGDRLPGTDGRTLFVTMRIYV